MLFFVVLLGALMAGFSVLFFLLIAPSEPFQSYLDLNAEWSGAALNALGDDVVVTGASISSSRFSLSIKRGCEAVQVGAFFVFAVLLWPTHVMLWRRLAGLVAGPLLLCVFNLVRIVSLYYTGVYFPRAFETMHVDVWQPAFIVLALVLWIAWIRWATVEQKARPHVAR